MLTVVDGREELLAEEREAPFPLREYLAAEMTALMATDDFLQAIPGHLPGDRASQARAPILLQRLRELSQLASGGRK